MYKTVQKLPTKSTGSCWRRSGSAPVSRRTASAALAASSSTLRAVLTSWLLERVRAEGTPSAHRTLVFGGIAASLVLLSIVTSGTTAFLALLGVGLFNSIMFPTIFTLTLERSTAPTSATSGLLVFGIIGGALLPQVAARIADAAGALQPAFVVPMLGYVGLTIFAVACIRTKAKTESMRINEAVAKQRTADSLGGGRWTIDQRYGNPPTFTPRTTGDEFRQSAPRKWIGPHSPPHTAPNKRITEGNKWLYKNKEHGMMSAAASLGRCLFIVGGWDASKRELNDLLEFNAPARRWAKVSRDRDDVCSRLLGRAHDSMSAEVLRAFVRRRRAATATRAPRLPPSSIGIAKPTVVSALRTPRYGPEPMTFSTWP